MVPQTPGHRKHSAPLEPVGWGLCVYKHTAPLGPGGEALCFYKHSGPLGPVDKSD